MFIVKRTLNTVNAIIMDFVCVSNFFPEIQIAFIIVQCTIIRTTELAAAQDRLAELERQKDEIMRSYSPAALLDKLQSKGSEQLHLHHFCCVF